MNYADRVKDTSASVGTGPITLFGAPITGFRSFLSAFPSGAVDVPYAIDDGAGNWEIGIGSFADSVLTRTQVLSSSSNGGLVDFVAGKKSVICTLPADLVESATNRSIAAASESAGHAEQTAQDRAQTAIDKAATAEDRIATAADREQTGMDAAAASSAKTAAELAASSAEESASSADAARVLAEAARDAALIQSGVYPDEPTGRAAVADGDAFKVQGAGEVAAYEYRRIDADTSVLIAEYPSIKSIVDRIDFNFAAGTDYVWGIIDSDGRLVASISRDGNFRAQYDGISPYADTSIDTVYAITDDNGRVLLRIGSDGTIYGKIDGFDAVVSEVQAARGTRTSLSARIGQSLDAYGMPRRHVWGEWYMRETRQRLRKLALGENAQLVIASIGDSWTHNRDRYSGPTAATLKAEYGSAGPGWTGFAWGFGGASNVWAGGNGNVNSADVTVTLTTGWSVHYGSSASPDICDIYSSASGATATVGYAASGNASEVVLYYVPGGAVRYRWNGGAWTALDLSAGSGLVTYAFAGVPAGAWTLEIENVSGTTTLCGVDVKKSTDGVRWHKLGATGSAASNWTGVSAAAWKNGLTSLAPNLVTILLGTNDQGGAVSAQTFASRIGAIVENVRTALPLADVLLIIPCANGSYSSPPMADYAAAVYQVAAEKKCAYLDLQYVFGDAFSEYASTSPRAWFNADKIHPEPATGGRAIVDAVVRLLTQI